MTKAEVALKGEEGDGEPDVGYSCIQGAVENLDRRVTRSTIARVLKEQLHHEYLRRAA